MKEYIIEILKIMAIAMSITFLWQQAEIITVGEVMPSGIDTIVALILTFSLYRNLKAYEKNKYKK